LRVISARTKRSPSSKSTQSKRSARSLHANALMALRTAQVVLVTGAYVSRSLQPAPASLLLVFVLCPRTNWASGALVHPGLRASARRWTSTFELERSTVYRGATKQAAVSLRCSEWCGPPRTRRARLPGCIASHAHTSVTGTTSLVRAIAVAIAKLICLMRSPPDPEPLPFRSL